MLFYYFKFVPSRRWKEHLWTIVCHEFVEFWICVLQHDVLIEIKIKLILKEVDDMSQKHRNWSTAIRKIYLRRCQRPLAKYITLILIHIYFQLFPIINQHLPKHLILLAINLFKIFFKHHFQISTRTLKSILEIQTFFHFHFTLLGSTFALLSLTRLLRL